MSFTPHRLCRPLLALCATAWLSAGAAQAQTILVDHSSRGAAPTLGGTWNEIVGTLANTPKAGAQALVDSTGAATGASIAYSGDFDAFSTQAAWAVGDQAWVDADATQDFFFSDDDATISMIFSGLTAGATYRVDHVAARETAGTGRQADYTIFGSYADSTPNGNDFNAQTEGFNSGLVLTWNAVVADAGGNIILTADPLGSGHYAYFSATRLSPVTAPVPETPSVALMGLGLAALGWGRRRNARKH